MSTMIPVMEVQIKIMILSSRHSSLRLKVLLNKKDLQ